MDSFYKTINGKTEETRQTALLHNKTGLTALMGLLQILTKPKEFSNNIIIPLFMYKTFLNKKKTKREATNKQ